jgi:dienelactone hydrolase
LSAAKTGLAVLRGLPDVDPRKIAIVAHSFGGSLTILQAEKERDLRALVIFSGAGYGWDRSPELRSRLLDAIAHVRAPVFFIHAANDYSLNPGKELDARLEQLGKPHRLKIYPPIGNTADDGHNFPLPGSKHLGTRCVRVSGSAHAGVTIAGTKLGAAFGAFAKFLRSIGQAPSRIRGTREPEWNHGRSQRIAMPVATFAAAKFVPLTYIGGCMSLEISVYELCTSDGFSGPMRHFRPLKSLQLIDSA